MKPLLLTLMVMGCTCAHIAQTQPPKEESPFESAEAQFVTEVIIPYPSIASGTVVLDAVLSDTGIVQKVEVRRDIGSITEPAVTAVKQWQFSPAMFEGKAIASRVPVAVTVRPRVFYADQVPLPPLKPQSEAAVQAEFQPAEVIRAMFPNSAGGAVTVVLEANVSETGKVEKVRVLRDVPTATAAAAAVVGKWRFMAATYNGKPVPSRIILAFVFKAPGDPVP